MSEKVQALKFEYLNTKSETISNDQNTKFKTVGREMQEFGTFRHLDFEFVSYFDIRISNFPFENLFGWGLINLNPAVKEPRLRRGLTALCRI